MNLLTKLLFPPRCVHCSELFSIEVADGVALCEECRKKWDNELLETCGICTRKINECRCVTDRMAKSRIASFSKLTYYYPQKGETVQNNLLYVIKRSRNKRALCFLSALLSDSMQGVLSSEGIDPRDAVLTYIPRRRAAKMEYGTDQAKELAWEISKRSGIPCYALLKRRRWENRAQKKLGVAERYKNARRSYLPLSKNAPDLSSKTVFLLDDMVTTGASMAVCASILYRMGAREVRSLAVASDVINRDPRSH